MDNTVDNCGLLIRLMGILTRSFKSIGHTLWITVDDVWINFLALIRENKTFPQFHKPITVMNFSFTYKYIGGQI